jgi:hypothetical protein
MLSLSPALALAGLLAGCGGEIITGAETTAERAYGEYALAASGRIQFQLTTLRTGALREIAERTANDVVGVPQKWVRLQQRGTEIVDLVREDRNPDDDEWSAPVRLAEFARLGRPVATATYRLLAVRTTLDGTTSEHRALEVCFQDAESCLVLDPVILQLSAFVESRQELKAQGWAATQGSRPVIEVGEFGAQARRCTLNSHPASDRIWITYPAWTQRYKNVFGMTLITKSLGGQQAGIACYVSGSSCRSSGFGYSNSSSCSSTLGYSCACKNTGNQTGSSTASTRSWSETKCTHKFIGSASVSWTRNGSGSGFSIQWDTNGSVDSNGGQIYNACSWH